MPELSEDAQKMIEVDDFERFSYTLHHRLESERGPEIETRDGGRGVVTIINISYSWDHRTNTWGINYKAFFRNVLKSGELGTKDFEAWGMPGLAQLPWFKELLEEYRPRFRPVVAKEPA